MKQTITILALGFFMASCGNNETKPTETKAAAEPPKEQAMNAEAEKGLNLIAKSDCLGCHKVEEKLNGPAYREVAQKYAGTAGVKDTLALHIIKGHVGTWGQVPMTPHPALSEEDAKAMVEYILSLKQ